MRIFVVGSSGQVARELRERAKNHSCTVITAGRDEIDIRNIDALRSYLSDNPFDAIINTAAFTDVNRAESSIVGAHEVNAIGARNVATAAASRSIPLIHISTDYVFNGSKTSAYLESDLTEPLNVYGQTKLDGEAMVQQAVEEHLIVRTSWLYSQFGSNFVKTMLRLARTRNEISVVDDQIGNPTHAGELSDALLDVCIRLHMNKHKNSSIWGTYHLASEGACSWAEFAEEVFKISRTYGGPTARVNPVSTEDYPSAAMRPKNSVLNSTKIYDSFGIRLSHWKTGLDHCISKIMNSEEETLKERSK